MIESSDAVIREDISDQDYRKALSALWPAEASPEPHLPCVSLERDRETRALRNEALPEMRRTIQAPPEPEGEILLPVVRAIRESDAQEDPTSGLVPNVRQALREIPGRDQEDAPRSTFLQPGLLVQLQPTGQSLFVGGGSARADESRGRHMAASRVGPRPILLPTLPRESEIGGPSHPTLQNAPEGTMDDRQRDHLVPTVPPTIQRTRDGARRNSLVHRFRPSRRLAIRLPWAQVPDPVRSLFRSVSCWKPKDLVDIPHLVAEALRADGWWLRSEIIWQKANPMPESVTDRPTKAHESLFLLAKSERYYYDGEAIREPHVEPERGRGTTRVPLKDERPEPGVRSHTLNEMDRNGNQRAYHPAGRNRRSVWTIGTEPFPLAHFATFPPALVEPCVKAGTSEKGACPACGAPWRRDVERTAMVIDRSERTHDLGRTRSSGTMLEPPTAVTLGWAPTCACAAGDPVPAVCLDPFGGAGTTALVADRLGRDAILVELKESYARMSEKRIREEAPLLTAVEVEAAAPAASDNGHGAAVPEQLALWESGG
jgi:DNA modification methylase